nr:hypothetical protein [Tanacetum cinerariifolium]
MDECVSMSIPMATERLDADLQGTPTDQTTYHRMIGWLMYLIASRPDIAFVTFVYARYQARHTVKHLKEVKRIFQYLRQSYNMGLWYPKNSGFEIIAYSDADHAGSEAEYVSLSACCAQVIWMRIHLLDYGYKYNKIPITEYQLADLFTKALPKEHFEYLVHHILMRCMTPTQLEKFAVEKEEKIKSLILSSLQRSHRLSLLKHRAERDKNVTLIDELCPPNKRYALMDANKKIDLDNPLYPNESEIMANIIQNHPLRFSIATSSSVPWIYLGQFWHTLQEDGSKYRLKFVLDRKEIAMTLNDFRRIFHLPQATDNNHERFVAALKARNKYHNLEDDAMVKNIFNLGKHKDDVGIKIPSRMITDEMKLTDHYRMYEKSRNELEAKQNVQKVKEHLIAQEIEKLVEGPKNIKNIEDDPYDDAYLEGENSAKRQKMSKHETFAFGESSSGQDIKSEPGLSLEILVSPHPQRPTLAVQSCQGDPKAPELSLVNQYLLYLKKGSLGSVKIVMSLHKFLAVIFSDDNIEERTSRWVEKCVKKFNPCARYNVKHWKNPHAKIFYIKKQKELEKPKEVVYSNSKIVQIIKTYWELGNEHKFITKIVARRANGSIVSITKSDYKNLNKNDIEDMYMLIVNHKVDGYAETGLLWSFSVFIKSTMI